MSTLPKSALDRNASVDATTTAFHATGDRPEVLDFLRAVCGAIANPPLDRREVEAGVLTAEDGASEHPALGWSLAMRQGAQGLGLVGGQGAPASSLTEDHVTEHLTRHFVTDNAFLIFSGPPPSDHERAGLVLPDGPRPARPRSHDSGLVLPAFLFGTPVAIVSFLGERWVSRVLAGLLVDRLTDEARHRRGWAYEIDATGISVEADTAVTALWCDGDPSRHREVLDITVSALRDLAEQGPTADELDHQKALARSALLDPRGVPDLLIARADRMLRFGDDVTPEDVLAAVESVGTAEIIAGARRALATLLLGGAEPQPMGIAGIPDRSEELPPQPDIHGERYGRRLLSRAPRDYALVVGEEGAALTSNGVTSGGYWRDVVGVIRAPSGRELRFRDGSGFTVFAGGLKDPAGAFARLDAATAEVSWEGSDEEMFGAD